MNIEQLRADMEAGTQGDWVAPAKYQSEIENTQGLTIASCWHEHAVDKEITLVGVLPCPLDESRANARRIARVPQLERIKLAADALAEFVSLVDRSFGGGRIITFLDGDITQCNKALAAYREATK